MKKNSWPEHCMRHGSPSFSSFSEWGYTNMLMSYTHISASQQFLKVSSDSAKLTLLCPYDNDQTTIKWWSRLLTLTQWVWKSEYFHVRCRNHLEERKSAQDLSLMRSLTWCATAFLGKPRFPVGFLNRVPQIVFSLAVLAWLLAMLFVGFFRLYLRCSLW